MPELAPWENPDLPAPFATIEREIEGRTRHFALWRWDKRIVWHDLDYPRLWWATLDVAASQGDWKRAIQNWKFGRAFSSKCQFGGQGADVGFHSSVTFSESSMTHTAFYVIADAPDQGLAREVDMKNWQTFGTSDNTHSQKRQAKFRESPVQLLWKMSLQFPKIQRSSTFINPRY